MLNKANNALQLTFARALPSPPLRSVAGIRHFDAQLNVGPIPQIIRKLTWSLAVDKTQLYNCLHEYSSRHKYILSGCSG